MTTGPALLLHMTTAGRDTFTDRTSPANVVRVKFNDRNSLVK